MISTIIFGLIAIFIIVLSIVSTYRSKSKNELLFLFTLCIPVIFNGIFLSVGYSDTTKTRIAWELKRDYIINAYENSTDGAEREKLLELAIEHNSDVKNGNDLFCRFSIDETRSIYLINIPDLLTY